MMHCDRPGVSMSPIDFIRNICVEHFEEESEVEDFLRNEWLPIEYDQPDVAHAEYLFASFLLDQNQALVFKKRSDIAEHFEKWLPSQTKDSHSPKDTVKQILRWVLGYG